MAEICSLIFELKEREYKNWIELVIGQWRRKFQFLKMDWGYQEMEI